MIDGLSRDSFNYTINQSLVKTDEFQIIFTFTTSISNKPLALLDFTPLNTLPTNQLKLSPTQVSTTLNDYYNMDEATKNLLKSTQDTITTSNTVSQNAFTFNSALFFGPYFGIKSLVSMDGIRYLRHFMIDFPPQVIAMFETKMPTSDLIPNVVLDQNAQDGSIPESFSRYDFSIYAFNNCGNTLIEGTVYICLGILMLMLFEFFNKNKTVPILVLTLRLVFVWNYSLSYFLSQYLALNLSTFLAYRFPAFNNPDLMAYFNLILSIFTGVLIAFILFFCFSVVRALRPSLTKWKMKKTSVMPINQNEIFNEVEESSVKKVREGSMDMNNTMDSPSRMGLGVFSAGYRWEYSQNSSKKGKLEYFEDFLNVESSKKMEDHSIIKTSILKNRDSEGRNLKPPVKFKKDIQNEEEFGDISKKHFDNEIEMSATVSSINKIPQESGKSDKNFAMRLQEIKKASFFSSFKGKIIYALSFINYPFDMNKEKNRLFLDKSFFALHKEFKHDSKFQSYYLILDLIRQSFFSFLVVEFYENPFKGLILINIVNLGFLLEYIILRPFKEKMDFFHTLINEICVTVSTICAFIMAYFEKFEIYDLQTKSNLGWAMVIANIIMIMVFLIRMCWNLCALLFMVMKMVFMLIVKKFRGSTQIHVVEIKLEGEKNKDQIIIQQIIEIENFLK